MSIVNSSLLNYVLSKFDSVGTSWSEYVIMGNRSNRVSAGDMLRDKVVGIPAAEAETEVGVANGFDSLNDAEWAYRFDDENLPPFEMVAGHDCTYQVQI